MAKYDENYESNARGTPTAVDRRPCILQPSLIGLMTEYCSSLELVSMASICASMAVRKYEDYYGYTWKIVYTGGFSLWPRPCPALQSPYPPF